MAAPTLLESDNIDNLGDLTLIVGPKSRRFLVSKVALRLASPVFRAMFTGKFVEAQANTKETILPEDDPEALKVVLLIAHLRFKEVPKTLEFALLVEMAKIVDKYDLVSLLRPWSGQWIAPHGGKLTQEGFEGWSWVAWTFGMRDEWCTVANHLWLHWEPLRIRALTTLSPGLKGMFGPSIMSCAKLIRCYT